MMRCSNCDRDYPSSVRFCHQCGEPLQAVALPAESPATRVAVSPAERRARAVARRRAPTRSSSLGFAIIVLLAAGVGLALVWYPSWMPPLTRVSAKLPEAPRPVDPLTPPPTPEPATTESPAAPPAPEPVSPPTPAPTASTPVPDGPGDADGA